MKSSMSIFMISRSYIQALSYLFIDTIIIFDTEAIESVDVQNIEHIAKDDKLVGDAVEKISEDWDFQKEQFCQQTGLRRQQHENHEQQLLLQNDENFEHELEQLLSET